MRLTTWTTCSDIADSKAGRLFSRYLGNQRRRLDALRHPLVRRHARALYRSDVLAAVGFPHGPRTWDEWRTAMQRIHDQKKCRWAILIPTNEYEPLTVLALSNHSALLNADGTRGAFSQPAFASAFDFYIDLFRRKWAPAVSNSEIANLYQQFAEGDFAMYITGPWNVGAFRLRLRRRCRTSGRRRHFRRAIHASRSASPWQADAVSSSFAPRSTKSPRGS